MSGSEAQVRQQPYLGASPFVDLSARQGTGDWGTPFGSATTPPGSPGGFPSTNNQSNSPSAVSLGPQRQRSSSAHDHAHPAFTVHLHLLKELVSDCAELKRLSKETKSFREPCRKLGAAGDEISVAARTAAARVTSEDDSTRLTKILSCCHRHVNAAQTLIVVYGQYSTVKKYFKLPIKMHTLSKLRAADKALANCYDDLWRFAFPKGSDGEPLTGMHSTGAYSGNSFAVAPSPDSAPDLRAHLPPGIRMGSPSATATVMLSTMPEDLMATAARPSALLDRSQEAPAELPAAGGPPVSATPPGAAHTVPELPDLREGGLHPAAARLRSRRTDLGPAPSMESFSTGRDLSRVSRGKPTSKSERTLHAGHMLRMAPPVTAVLYVDPVGSHAGGSIPGGSMEWDGTSFGCVWFCCGCTMHVHDIKSTSTSYRKLPEKFGVHSEIKVLALDAGSRFVWAGHEDGVISVWREANSRFECLRSDLASQLMKIYCMDAVKNMVMAAGCEGGRVVLLRLLDSPHSPNTADPNTEVTHEDRLRIRIVGELRASIPKDHLMAEALPEHMRHEQQRPQPAGSVPAANTSLFSKIRHMALAGLGRGSSESEFPPPSMESFRQSGSSYATVSNAPPLNVTQESESGLQSRASQGAMPSMVSGALSNGESIEGAESMGAGLPIARNPALPSTLSQASALNTQRTATRSPSQAASEASADLPMMLSEPAMPGPTRGASVPEDSVLPGTASLGTGPLLQTGLSGTVGGGGGGGGRRSARLETDDGGSFIRKRSFIGINPKMLRRMDGGSVLGVMEKAHETKVECILVAAPYIFTSSAATSSADAEIRMWVQGKEKDKDELQYGFQSQFHCGEHKAALTMCTIPWETALSARGRQPAIGEVSSPKPARSSQWRLLTGHESGHILIFDPSNPHFEPMLRIRFSDLAGALTIRKLAVLVNLNRIFVARSDRTVQLLPMITERTRIMKSAKDHARPHEGGEGVVDVRDFGEVLKIGEKRNDMVAVSKACGDVVTANSRNVRLFLQQYFEEKVGTDLAQMNSLEVQSSGPSRYGEIISRHQSRQSGVSMDLEGIDLVDAKEVEMHGRLLGCGAFGFVREGTHLHTPVAIKVLKANNGQTSVLSSLAGTQADEKQDIKKGLQREVKLLRSIRHPNVIFFRGLCLAPPMIITELCEHGSVSEVIELTQRILSPYSTLNMAESKRDMYLDHMVWEGRVRLALDAAKGMLYLHTKNLLHCDLKTPNLLVNANWDCKVADFGLSRTLSKSHPGSSMPMANNPMWQAPEVIENPADSSKQGDVYSFGIIMWELLAMERPWKGMPHYLINNQVKAGSRPCIPHWDKVPLVGASCGDPTKSFEDFSRLMQQCWDQDKANRPSFEEIVKALESIRSTMTAAAKSRQRQPPYAQNGGNSSWAPRASMSIQSSTSTLPRVASNASSEVNQSPLSTAWPTGDGPMRSVSGVPQRVPTPVDAAGNALADFAPSMGHEEWLDVGRSRGSRPSPMYRSSRSLRPLSHHVTSGGQGAGERPMSFTAGQSAALGQNPKSASLPGDGLDGQFYPPRFPLHSFSQGSTSRYNMGPGTSLGHSSSRVSPEARRDTAPMSNSALKHLESGSQYGSREQYSARESEEAAAAAAAVASIDVDKLGSHTSAVDGEELESLMMQPPQDYRGSEGGPGGGSDDGGGYGYMDAGRGYLSPRDTEAAFSPSSGLRLHQVPEEVGEEEASDYTAACLDSPFLPPGEGGAGAVVDMSPVTMMEAHSNLLPTSMPSAVQGNALSGAWSGGLPGRDAPGRGAAVPGAAAAAAVRPELRDGAGMPTLDPTGPSVGSGGGYGGFGSGTRAHGLGWRGAAGRPGGVQSAAEWGQLAYGECETTPRSQELPTAFDPAGPAGVEAAVDSAVGGAAAAVGGEACVHAAAAPRMDFALQDFDSPFCPPPQPSHGHKHSRGSSKGSTVDGRGLALSLRPSSSLPSSGVRRTLSGSHLENSSAQLPMLSVSQALATPRAFGPSGSGTHGRSGSEGESVAADATPDGDSTRRRDCNGHTRAQRPRSVSATRQRHVPPGQTGPTAGVPPAGALARPQMVLVPTFVMPHPSGEGMMYVDAQGAVVPVPTPDVLRRFESASTEDDHYSGNGLSSARSIPSGPRRRYSGGLMQAGPSLEFTPPADLMQASSAPSHGFIMPQRPSRSGREKKKGAGPLNNVASAELSAARFHRREEPMASVAEERI